MPTTKAYYISVIGSHWCELVSFRALPPYFISNNSGLLLSASANILSHNRITASCPFTAALALTINLNCKYVSDPFSARASITSSINFFKSISSSFCRNLLQCRRNRTLCRVIVLRCPVMVCQHRPGRFSLCFSEIPYFHHVPAWFL